MKFIKVLLTLIFSIQLSLVAMEQQDEMKFFYVGGGSATLIDRKGKIPQTNKSYVPVLIDAGSIMNASRKGVYQTKMDSVTEISSAILSLWENKTDKEINIIITHPEDDHYKYVVPIILRLKAALSPQERSAFKCNILCGGYRDQYNDNFKSCVHQVSSKGDPGIRVYYASPSVRDKKNQGLFTAGALGNLRFLAESGCITHLFVPERHTEKNKESIITRIMIKGISALIAGDADHTTKADMCLALRDAGMTPDVLESDIYLLAHHGGESANYLPWEKGINPRAIVISAGEHGNYKHPRASVIASLLRILAGRIWTDRVQPHVIQFFTDGSFTKDLTLYAQAHSALFRRLDDYSRVGKALVLTDLPIYTTWSNGTISFQGDAAYPQFLEAPVGITDCVALPLIGFANFTIPELKKICPTNADMMQLIHLLDFMKKELGILREDIADTYKKFIIDLRKKGLNFENIAHEFIKDYPDDEQEMLHVQLEHYLGSLSNTEDPDIH